MRCLPNINNILVSNWINKFWIWFFKISKNTAKYRKKNRHLHVLLMSRGPSQPARTKWAPPIFPRALEPPGRNGPCASPGEVYVRCSIQGPQKRGSSEPSAKDGQKIKALPALPRDQRTAPNSEDIDFWWFFNWRRMQIQCGTVLSCGKFVFIGRWPV